jgi:transcription antitermination factor NusG
MLWYALHVVSCAEALVSRRLQDASVESYYPARMVPSKRKYRRDVEQRFFPGYVFARFDLAGRGPVITIPQVIQILGPAHAPTPIPDSEIAAVRMMTHSADASLAPCPYVAVGESVVIQRGSLQGLDGIVLRTKGKTRVVVSIATLRQSMSAEVDAADCILRKPMAMARSAAQ